MFTLVLTDGLATLTLERPERRNAIPLDGWDILAAKVADAGATARLLAVTGAGGAFCAGADLTDFPMDAATAARFRMAMRKAMDALRDLSIPTVALIDGACFGAGVALAMACDLRVADEAARFAITPAKIGISYPQEDIYRLVTLAGPGQAARLLLTGETIDAGEAQRIGLVDMIASGDARAAILQTILGNGAEGLAALKRGISLAASGVRQDAAQDAAFDALMGGPELIRRLEARRRT